MNLPSKLRVIVLKPSKYYTDGYVERFRFGFMPNSTPIFMRSLTPDMVEGVPVEVELIDEYTHNNLDYLQLLHEEEGVRTLLALVGVQSHQMHRAIDLAAYARKHGVKLCVLGGPHAMTCETDSIQNCGLSISQSEAEVAWPEILQDAVLKNELKPVYGTETRWIKKLDSPVLRPPDSKYIGWIRRFAGGTMGIHPARGCPYTCNFCSVIKISGRNMRSQSIETIISSIRAAKEAGIRHISFTSDNFNKYADAVELLNAMIEEDFNVSFGVQCDVQVGRQPEFIKLLGRAGCHQIFVGVESFNRETLMAASKYQNDIELYKLIVQYCEESGIDTFFSSIFLFPTDTPESIAEHMRKKRELRPQHAMFHLLTPIPGTDQYDDFLARGLITETNLDRFDSTCVTWKHPTISQDFAFDLLWKAYRDFYNVKDVTIKLLKTYRRRGFSAGNAYCFRSVAMAVFARICVFLKTHPGRGGMVSTRIDHVDDYITLRRDMYGLSLIPLPKSLKLSPEDEEFNRNAKIIPVSMEPRNLVARQRA